MIVKLKYRISILLIFILKFGYSQDQNIKEGIYKKYDKTKKHLTAIEIYHNNVPDGLWSIYHDKGDSINIIYKNGLVYREKYWNNNGLITLDIFYEYKNKDTLVSFTKWSEISPFIMKRKEYFLNRKPVEYFIEKYDNGNKKSEGYYSVDSNNVLLDRDQYFSFIDDFYINGIIIKDNKLGITVTKTTLQDEYYENGNIKMKIIPVQKNKSNGQIIYYTEEGRIRQINSIEYGKLSKEEIHTIIYNAGEQNNFPDIIQQRFSEETNCWYLEGDSYYFNDEGMLIKKYSYHRGQEN